MEDLKPGRELDKKIYEFVMGGRDSVLNARNQSEFESARRMCELCPEYSTDIAAAWKVVEKIGMLFTFSILKIHKNGQWCIGLRHPITGYYEDVVSEAGTAPHAICLAALKVMESK